MLLSSQCHMDPRTPGHHRADGAVLAVPTRRHSTWTWRRLNEPEEEVSDARSIRNTKKHPVPRRKKPRAIRPGAAFLLLAHGVVDRVRERIDQVGQDPKLAGDDPPLGGHAGG